MARIFLVRHGETEWNRDRRWQGWADSKLTQRGEEQARNNAKIIVSEGVTRVFASPLRRVQDTLECMATQSTTGFTVEFDDRLKEISMGDWEGVFDTDIRSQYAHEYEQWLRDREVISPPNGETYADVRNRLKAFLLEKQILVECGINEYSQFREKPEYRLGVGENIAIVSHGVAIKLILELCDAIRSAATESGSIPNDAVHAVQEADGTLKFSHYRNGEGPFEGVLMRKR